MLRNLNCAIRTLLLTLASCGGGGDGTTNPPGNDPDGTNDGSTSGGDTDGGKDSGTTGVPCDDVACGANQVCRERYDGKRLCTSSNPLIDEMRMGLWTLASFNGMPREENRFILSVDPFQPDCSNAARAFDGRLPIQEPGDACILFSQYSFLILDGTSVRLSFEGSFGDGHVLEDGSRIEYDSIVNDEITEHAVYVKLFSCLNCPAGCGCSDQCGCTMVAP